MVLANPGLDRIYHTRFDIGRWRDAFSPEITSGKRGSGISTGERIQCGQMLKSAGIDLGVDFG
jgi:hypothetical protein